MAKNDKKNAKTKAAAPAANTPEFKYGVADLAETLGIEAASVRVALRKNNVEKAGKSYGWNSAKEMESVAAQLRQPAKSAPTADKPKAKVKAAGTEKAARPVAKAKVKAKRAA